MRFVLLLLLGVYCIGLFSGVGCLLSIGAPVDHSYYYHYFFLISHCYVVCCSRTMWLLFVKVFGRYRYSLMLLLMLLLST